jgi:hypothetical protein
LGSVSDLHSYDTPGVKPVTLVVTDNSDDTGKCTTTVKVNDWYVIYCPLCLYKCFDGRVPMRIFPAIKPSKLPKGEKGTVYFERRVCICPELPEGGRFYLSSQPDEVAPIKVDDALVVKSGGDVVIYHDFKDKVPGPPYLKAASIEIPRKTMEEELAGQCVTVQLKDVYGVWYASFQDIYLIWVP